MPRKMRSHGKTVKEAGSGEQSTGHNQIGKKKKRRAGRIDQR